MEAAYVKDYQLLPGHARQSPSLGTLAWNFLILGATAFGGPPVHIGMFKARFVDRVDDKGQVEKHGWLSQTRFAELFAMANCLPGPSSTQVAFAIGITQQGVLGGLVSGFTFIIPGAITLTLLGFASHSLKDQVTDRTTAESAVAIACSSCGVALVFIAISGLVKKMVFDSGDQKKLGMICCGTASVCLLVNPPPAWLNPTLIFLGGAITAIFPVKKANNNAAACVDDPGKTGLTAGSGAVIFLMYFAMAAFTLWKDASDDGWVMPFLTAGMFVWGGGPVVLPMLMTYLVPTWIDPTIFLTGIAFAEMMPGPVFNMSCFLGVQLALAHGWHWLAGTSICWAGLMLPGIILIFGAVPLWDKLRSFDAYSRALPGLNAAAVGLLVTTIFAVYGTLEERSPWKPGSRAVVLLSYCAVEMIKMDVLVVVFLAGLSGFAWHCTQ